MKRNLLSNQREIAIRAAILLGVALLYVYAAAAPGISLFPIIGGAVLTLLSLGHAMYMLGRKRAVAFFLISVGLSYLAETISIVTCNVTCYEYTAALGKKVGVVPISIPVMWFAMIYASYVIANLIAEGKPISTKGNNAWVIWLSLLTALVMTAWDLTLDPYMVFKEGGWIWKEGGEYLGIPFANYIGWMQTVFVINLVYRLVERDLKPAVERPISALTAVLPLAWYAIITLPGTWIAEPETVRLLPPFAMGLPILAALGRYFQTSFTSSQGSGASGCLLRRLLNKTFELPAPATYDPRDPEVDRPVRRLGGKIILGVAITAFVLQLSISGYMLATGVPSADRMPWELLLPVFATFTLAHAIYMLGWRRGLAFLGVVLVICTAFEVFGQRTGLIFGRYEYTDVLGPKLLGAVPAVVPLAYFMLLYPSYIIANLIVGGRPTLRQRTIGWMMWAALLTAMIFTAWDLLLDPLAVQDYKAWIWLDGGPYFGVPFQNFAGWVLTTFTAIFIYRLMGPWIPLKPFGPVTPRITLMPLVIYGLFGFGAFYICCPQDIRLLPPFVMGIPLFAALLRLYEPG